MAKAQPVFVISIEKYNNDELVDFIADHVEKDHIKAINYAKQIAEDICSGKLVLMNNRFDSPVIYRDVFKYVVFDKGSRKNRIEVVYNWTRV